MSKYIIRLDDAAIKMDVAKWGKMEEILTRYNIRPLVGVIPFCQDAQMEKYAYDESFWDKVKSWEAKGWTIAMHGYNHVYITNQGGINPRNKRSEFAGVSYDEQCEKISKGVMELQNHGINPRVFFAPSHTFDLNTVLALKEHSDIRIISDMIASKPFTKYGMVFVPQQSGKARKLPMSLVTFCYHPNTMNDAQFEQLESFLQENKSSFVDFPMDEVNRSRSLFDLILVLMYRVRDLLK